MYKSTMAESFLTVPGAHFTKNVEIKIILTFAYFHKKS